jgi:hypothetical protein
MTGQLDIVSQKKDWERAYGALPCKTIRGSHRYLSASAKLWDGAIAEAAVLREADEFVVHAYVKRSIPLDTAYFDLISPYDFGAFWFSSDSGDVQSRLLKSFEERFREYAAANNIVSEFIRLDPFSAMNVQFNIYERRKHQDNVVIHLNKTHADIRREYSQSRRNQVLQGEKNQLSLQFSKDFGEFTAIYHASMDRHGADRDFYFPISFMEALKDDLVLTYVRTPDGALCAAHVYLIEGDAIYLYLSASVPDKLHLRPNDYGYDKIAEYAIERGLKYFHLGGGADTLHRYKSAFSPTTIPFFHLRQVFMPAKYDELCEKHDASFNGDKQSSFFPRYRQAFRSGDPLQTLSASP